MTHSSTPPCLSDPSLLHGVFSFLRSCVLAFLRSCYETRFLPPLLLCFGCNIRQVVAAVVPAAPAKNMLRCALLLPLMATLARAATDYCVVLSTQRVHVTDNCLTLPSNTTSQAYDVAGSPGEWEYRQLLIPVRSNTTVQLTFEALRRADGKTLPSSIFDSFAVGYVDCQKTTRYSPSGGGWHADPLLPLPEGSEAPLQSNVASTLWITLKIPVDAVPGAYEGFLVATVRGMDSLRIPVRVEVWNCPPLVKHDSLERFGAIWSAALFPEKGTNGVLRDPDGLGNFYTDGKVPDEVQMAYLNTMGDRLVPPDHLYKLHPLPNLTNYSWLVHEAGATLLNLGDVSTFGGQDRNCSVPITQALVDDLIAMLRPAMETLESWGLTKHASPYIYGFDEQHESCEENIRTLFGAAKAAFPALKTAAVLNWPGGLPDDLPLDIWINQYELYNETTGKRWKQSSKDHKVYLYHCIEPSGSAFLNTFIERPWVQARLLYWFASLPSVRADGWLYYATTIWRPFPGTKHHRLRRVDSGTPKTDFPPANYIWSPRTDIFANGDGQFVYPGANGPVSTSRLEHIRSASQDARLFSLARQQGMPEDVLGAYLKQLVRSPTDHTDDPALLENVRRSIASEVCTKE